MTVHASKGLEFPITIVSGMTTQPSRRRGVQVVWDDDTWHLTSIGDDGSFEDVAPIDELMSDAERRRMLYVACTRAVDHLVLSLHRRTPDDHAPKSGAAGYTSAELLFHAGAAVPESGVVLADFAPATPPGLRRPSPADPGRLDDIDAWRAELAAVMSAANHRSAIAATRLADEVRLLRDRDMADDPGLDKQPVNIDLPPWQRGRYGTSIGRAVHGTLQFCDLTTGDDIDDLARSQCAAESILGLDRTVAALARSAIRAPIVRTVVDGAEHWRELFIAAPVGQSGPRGVHRPARAHRGGSGHRRLQDRSVVGAGADRRADRSLPHAARGVRRGTRGDARRARRRRRARALSGRR